MTIDQKSEMNKWLVLQSDFQVDYHERHDLTGSNSRKAFKKILLIIWFHDRRQSTSRVGSNLWGLGY